MKKLTTEEFEKLPLKGKANGSPFFLAIINLRVGESLLITKKEYTQKRKPGKLCSYIMKRFPEVKYQWGALGDGSGWAVKRIE